MPNIFKYHIWTSYANIKISLKKTTLFYHFFINIFFIPPVKLSFFQDKFLTPQLEIVSNDPGKFLAWLVLLSCLLTFILGHIIYLVLFLLIYITWAYSEHLQDKVVDKEEDQNEWLLDKFFCFLQQLDNGRKLRGDQANFYFF